VITAEEFWQNVKKGASDECWPWARATHPRGYGRVWFGGKRVGAHRIAWELENGQIAPGLGILHSCDNPPCCNPAHLTPGTQAENLADMAKKGRHWCSKKKRCKRDHPLDGDNIYTYSDGRRQCKTCRLEVQRIWHAKRKAS
jgi:hypothetical protein